MTARRLLTLVVVLGSGAIGSGGCDPVEPFWAEDFERAMPEVRDCRLSPAEHDGFYIRVFANPEARTAYVDGVYPFAEGTLLVKGEYEDDACTTLARVSSMRKLAAGADPDLGDWAWQRTDTRGRVLDDTAVRSCAGCHAACDARDRACTDP